ncbi:TPA: hypothetical protein ACHJX8_003651 [Yersinia enterocolitica]|uniref:hypothetical protein n=1 Tax=Yersinia TaxID=629 RepID=UPI0012D43439|nr:MULTISPECIES: hypothetical protein [Yersinia]MCB5320188.1 hypothetical protein [Yersinia massiliensis]QKJ10059.1 hypothetical protein HRD68_04505 [Yersinia massiliensis]HEC1651203.1 hypothetical protein [Yersinia enterocolitica]
MNGSNQKGQQKWLLAVSSTDCYRYCDWLINGSSPIPLSSYGRDSPTMCECHSYLLE